MKQPKLNSRARIVEDYTPLEDRSQILSEDIKKAIDKLVVESPRLFHTWKETGIVLKTILIVYVNKPMQIFQTFLTDSEFQDPEAIKNKELYPVEFYTEDVNRKLSVLQRQIENGKFIPLSEYQAA